MPGEDKDFSEKLAKKLIWSFIVVPIIYFFPSVVPFGLFEFWSTKGNIFQWIYAAWPIFAWAFAATFIICAFTLNDRYTNLNAERILKQGILISIHAGLLEEILFRWLFFFSGIVSLKIINFLLFGFLGFGVVEWSRVAAGRLP